MCVLINHDEGRNRTECVDISSSETHKIMVNREKNHVQGCESGPRKGKNWKK